MTKYNELKAEFDKLKGDGDKQNESMENKELRKNNAELLADIEVKQKIIDDCVSENTDLQKEINDLKKEEIGENVTNDVDYKELLKRTQIQCTELENQMRTEKEKHEEETGTLKNDNAELLVQMDVKKIKNKRVNF